MMLATVVETKELLQTVIASLVAGAGVTATFSTLIFGATKFADFRRDNRAFAATMAAVLMLVAFLLTAGAIVVGLIAMTQK
jgi:hypothetical protein